jgi:hypothetical protein
MEMSQSDDNLEEKEDLASTALEDCPVIRSQSIEQIESAIDQLSHQCTVEQIVHGINVTSILLSRAKLLRQTLEQIAVRWIDSNGPIEIGDIRYTTGHHKRVLCTDILGCAQVVLEMSGGDLASLCEHLNSNPYKYGSVHRLVGNERFSELFRIEHKPKLVEDKAQKQLIRVDRRYVRPIT